jgi:hypothetical protein
MFCFSTPKYPKSDQNKHAGRAHHLEDGRRQSLRPDGKRRKRENRW